MDICFNMPISIVMQKGCISSVAEKVALLGKRAFLVCGSEVSSIGGINAVTDLAEKAYSLSELTNSSIAITTREEYIRILQQI